MSDNLYLFGSRIRELRKSTGMTQKQFCEKIGIRVETLCHYENGCSLPNASTLYMICDYCGVSADYLLGLKNMSMSKLPEKHILQFISERTGLSEKVVRALMEEQRSKNND